MDRRVRALVLAGLLVLASVPLASGAAADAHADAPADPSEDRIGWEAGYWHNESIAVDQSDGLSAAEREAFVARTAARIEHLRGREFTREVPVSVISRDEFGNRTAGNASEAYGAWNNQVWEALFIVGEDRDVETVLHETSTGRTLGAYFFERREIAIVADAPGDAAIDRRTLAHELVHALQDQHHDLTNLTRSARVQDEQLAVNGLIEGEARYLELRYEERCGTEWTCVESLEGGGGGDADLNLGVYFTLIFPYSDGPPWVRSRFLDGGWPAVDAAFERPPNSSEQLIHATDEEPTPLAVTDEARGGWAPFPEQGRNGTDRAGEASMFAMLWYQTDAFGATAVPRSTVFETSGSYDLYDYESEPTSGWANDAVRPYRRIGPSGPEYGYVWVSEWDTPADAIEFRAAHRQVLAAHDARRLDGRTFVIDDGPFADAFRVVRDGQRVTIVNAPRVGDLGALRPSLEGVGTDPAAESPRPWTPSSPLGPRATPVGNGSVTRAPAQPGFDATAALLGLLVLLGGVRLRRRSGGQG